MRGSVASLYSAPYKRFLGEVKAMRLDAGLTQEQLVKKLRQSQTYASKSESGERRLDLVDGWRFARRAAKTPRSFSTA